MELEWKEIVWPENNLYRLPRGSNRRFGGWVNVSPMTERPFSGIASHRDAG